jgi:hypothetical protein
MRHIARFFRVIAGVDNELINSCPQREQNLAVIQGLLTAFNWLYLVCVTSFALRTISIELGTNLWSSITLGLLIASLLTIFDVIMIQSSWDVDGMKALERQGLRQRSAIPRDTYRSKIMPQRLGYILARFTISIAVSGLLATLIMQHFFESDILANIDNTARQMNATAYNRAEIAYNKLSTDKDRAVNEAERAVQLAEDATSSEANTSARTAIVDAKIGELKAAEERRTALVDTFNKANARISSINNEVSRILDLRDAEADGRVIEMAIDNVQYHTSGQPGQKERYARYTTLIERRQGEAKSINDSLTNIQQQMSYFDDQAAKLRNDLEGLRSDAPNSPGANSGTQTARDALRQAREERSDLIQKKKQIIDNELASDPLYRSVSAGPLARFEAFSRQFWSWPDGGWLLMLTFCLMMLEMIGVIARWISRTGMQYAQKVAAADVVMGPMEQNFGINQKWIDLRADLYQHMAKRNAAMQPGAPRTPSLGPAEAR